jgi:hypothetical protein
MALFASTLIRLNQCNGYGITHALSPRVGDMLPFSVESCEKVGLAEPVLAAVADGPGHGRTVPGASWLLVLTWPFPGLPKPGDMTYLHVSEIPLLRVLV